MQDQLLSFNLLWFVKSSESKVQPYIKYRSLSRLPRTFLTYRGVCIILFTFRIYLFSAYWNTIGKALVFKILQTMLNEGNTRSLWVSLSARCRMLSLQEGRNYCTVYIQRIFMYNRRRKIHPKSVFPFNVHC